MNVPLRLEIDGRLATITLDDPERRNLLGTDMFDALEDALERTGDSRLIRIRAQGKAFCSGFDLAACVEDPGALGVFTSRLGEIVRRLRHARQVVVGEVQGAALAGGCALASACDIVLASTTASFGYPVHRIGVSPAVAMPALLATTTHGAARALALSGNTINAEEAHNCGLVHHVYAPDQLSEASDRLCAQLLTHPEGVLAETKRSFEELNDPTEDGLINEGISRTINTAESEEARRMLLAFWSGKASS